jgi:hypothetical protein
LISAEFKLGGYGSGIQRDIRERQKEKEKKNINLVHYNLCVQAGIAENN